MRQQADKRGLGYESSPGRCESRQQSFDPISSPSPLPLATTRDSFAVFVRPMFSDDLPSNPKRARREDTSGADDRTVPVTTGPVYIQPKARGHGLTVHKLALEPGAGKRPTRFFFGLNIRFFSLHFCPSRRLGTLFPSMLEPGNREAPSKRPATQPPATRPCDPPDPGLFPIRKPAPLFGIDDKKRLLHPSQHRRNIIFTPGIVGLRDQTLRESIEVARIACHRLRDLLIANHIGQTVRAK